MAAQLAIYAAIAGMQLLQGIQQANNIQKQAELQKKLDELNIEQAQLDAFMAEADGYTQEARYQNVIDQIKSAQEVAFIAQDVDPSFGTARDIQEESTVNANLNKIDIQNQAHMKALGFQNQAINMRTQSKLNSLAAETYAINVRNSAILGAAGTAAKGFEGSPKSGSTGYEKPPIQFEEPIKGGADNFNYDAYYGFAPRSRA